MIAWFGRITTTQWLDDDEQGLNDGSHGGRSNAKKLSMLTVPPGCHVLTSRSPKCMATVSLFVTSDQLSACHPSHRNCHGHGNVSSVSSSTRLGHQQAASPNDSGGHYPRRRTVPPLNNGEVPPLSASTRRSCGCNNAPPTSISTRCRRWPFHRPIAALVRRSRRTWVARSDAGTDSRQLGMGVSRCWTGLF